MFGTTMLLTVGQALDRAQIEGVPVRVLMSGEWFSGTIVNTDSQSLMLDSEDGTSYVMRVDAITCVASATSSRQQVPSQPTPPRI
jgi:hypothetical protein